MRALLCQARRAAQICRSGFLRLGQARRRLLSVPSILALDLPFFWTSRESITMPWASASSSRAARAALALSLYVMSKAASTAAASVPLLTFCASALPPAISARQSTISDLPAPVSPVSTFRPFAKSSSMSSIRAKSLTFSDLSMRTSWCEDYSIFLGNPASLQPRRLPPWVLRP